MQHILLAFFYLLYTDHEGFAYYTKQQKHEL